MSHITNVNLKVKDLDALKTACTELGLEFRENQRTYAWWGTFVGGTRTHGDHDPATFGKGQHAIGLPGATGRMGPGGPWEIGVVASKDGAGFDLLYDSYGSAGRALETMAGEGLSRLRQEYAAAVTLRAAHRKLAAKGFVAQREMLANGMLRVRLVKR